MFYFFLFRVCDFFSFCFSIILINLTFLNKYNNTLSSIILIFNFSYSISANFLRLNFYIYSYILN